MRASRSGKMPTTSVRRRISRFSRSEGLLLQIWRQTSLGKAVNASTSGRACSRCSATSELVGQRVEEPVELGVHRGGGLVVDRVQQCPTHGQLLFGQTAIKVRGVVGATPLPR